MKLKRCPFCGGVPAFGDNEQGGVYIECRKCNSSSTMMFPEKCDVKKLLAERWNERTKTPFANATIVGFNEWWDRDGLYIDPDTEDVSWFDKRRELAQMAFAAGRAGLGNYVANLDTFPTEVTFATGRVVSIRDGDGGHAYLDVK